MRMHKEINWSFVFVGLLPGADKTFTDSRLGKVYIRLC